MNTIVTDFMRQNFVHPVSKEYENIEFFITAFGYPDARVHLKNTKGYDNWLAGQQAYEKWEASGTFYNNDPSNYLEEIKRDKILYDRLSIEGSVLDVGGGIGTVREFLNIDVPFVSIDPFENLSVRTPRAKKIAYQCLNRPLEFVCGFAEFLPFKAGSFDVVHMRSMLDHVQVPDLALLEAGRVLNDNGKLIIGMTVEGGRPGTRLANTELLKGMVKSNLARLGFERYRDHHTWHPTYDGLIGLLKSNGFDVVNEFWQEGHSNKVVYLACEKSSYFWRTDERQNKNSQ